MTRGRKPKHGYDRIHVRLKTDTIRLLRQRAVLDRHDGIGSVVDELAALAIDRDAYLQAALARVRLLEANEGVLLGTIKAKDDAFEHERRRRLKADAEAGIRRRRAKAPKPRAEAKLEAPDLDAIPSQVACTTCQGPRTALDDTLGNPDCAACRAARIPGGAT